MGNSREWEMKLDMLSNEYKKNIQTLQKEYTKAMINAVSQETNMNRSSLMRMISSSI